MKTKGNTTKPERNTQKHTKTKENKRKHTKAHENT